MWLLLKDLTDEEVAELQDITAEEVADGMKLDYADNWMKYMAPHATNTIAARQIRYDKSHGIFDITDVIHFSYDNKPASFERTIEGTEEM